MSFLSSTGLDRFSPTQRGARSTRVIATGLLFVMAVVYFAAHVFEQHHPAAGFVRAFAEAAMVGGLADWFAVTALFRHPLGLPIPHTAIIPRNKDRIGDTLALFLRENFLTPSVVAKRMRPIDIAAAIGRWLAAPPKGDRLGQGSGRLLGDVIESLADDRLGTMVKGAIAARLRSIDLAPILATTIESAIDQNRHVPLLEALIRWANRSLSDNEALIRQMVHDKAGTVMRWTGLDERLAQAIIDGLTKMLNEMADDPSHPLRIRAEQGLYQLVSDLRHDRSMQERVAHFRDMAITNPAIVGWIEGMWQSSRATILRAVRDPQLVGSGRLGEAIRQLGKTLQDDLALRLVINRFARRAIVGTVATYGIGIVKLVSDTVRGWDTKTVTGRLEAAVGRDLQYIRINGTLVGGLVGLVLHVLDQLL